jgi:hypothetical protein
MGDVFVRNPDGTLDFVDRVKYLIKSGGENVYPAEIERVLLQDVRVADAAVVRAPDPKWGEVPVAFVARRDDSLAEADLLARCRAELAGYKQPKRICFIALDDFPRSASGKIQRHEVGAWLQRAERPRWNERRQDLRRTQAGLRLTIAARNGSADPPMGSESSRAQDRSAVRAGKPSAPRQARSQRARRRGSMHVDVGQLRVLRVESIPYGRYGHRGQCRAGWPPGSGDRDGVIASPRSRVSGVRRRIRRGAGHGGLPCRWHVLKQPDFAHEADGGALRRACERGRHIAMVAPDREGYMDSGRRVVEARHECSLPAHQLHQRFDRRRAAASHR